MIVDTVPDSAIPRRSRASSTAPAWNLVCAAARARSRGWRARATAPPHARAGRRRPRSHRAPAPVPRNAPARPRRAHRGSTPRVRDARRGDQGRGSGPWPPRGLGGPRAAPAGRRPGRWPSERAGGGTPPGGRATADLPIPGRQQRTAAYRAGLPRATPASGRRPGPPPPRAAGGAQPGAAAQSPEEALLDAGGDGKRRPQPEAPTGACVGLSPPRGNSSRASGFPRVSATIRSTTLLSNRAGRTDCNKARVMTVRRTGPDLEVRQTGEDAAPTSRVAI